MIRINLLPVRAAKKKESLRFQLTLGGLIILFVFSLSMAFYWTVKNEATALAGDIERGNEELRTLKTKIGELSRLKEQKRIVEEKLNIITSLEAARIGPVNLFRMISESIPERAWLQSLKDEGMVITLKGFASTDEDVAEFMRRIERHNPGRVELEVAQRVIEPETKMDVVSFTIRLEKG